MQLRPGYGFGHIVVTARIQNSLSITIESESRHGDDRNVFICFPDLFCSFNSVHVRHFDVHEDEIGMNLCGQFNGFYSIDGAE